jgi:molybdopterin biosynthesis enzyme MoaB
MNSESSRLRPAILIISETAFKDPTTDRAGDILRETLDAEGGDRWAEPLLEIVPDDAARIELAIRRWADDETNHVNLIITTGGTGFASRDVTPEVVPFALHNPVEDMLWLISVVGHHTSDQAPGSWLGVSPSSCASGFTLSYAHQARHAGSLSAGHTM